MPEGTGTERARPGSTAAAPRRARAATRHRSPGPLRAAQAVPVGRLACQAGMGTETDRQGGPYPVAIFFSDAASVRWHRDRDGALHQVRVPSPRASCDPRLLG